MYNQIGILFIYYIFIYVWMGLRLMWSMSLMNLFSLFSFMIPFAWNTAWIIHDSFNEYINSYNPYRFPVLTSNGITTSYFTKRCVNHQRSRFTKEKAPSLPLMAVIFLCGIIMVKGLQLSEATWRRWRGWPTLGWPVDAGWSIGVRMLMELRVVGGSIIVSY